MNRFYSFALALVCLVGALGTVGCSTSPVDYVKRQAGKLVASPDEKLADAARVVKEDPNATNIARWEKAYADARDARVQKYDEIIASNEAQIKTYEESARVNPTRAADINASAARYQQTINEIRPKRDFYAKLDPKIAKTGDVLPENQLATMSTATLGK